MTEDEVIEALTRAHIDELAAQGLSARWYELAGWQRDAHILVEKNARRLVANWHGSVPIIQGFQETLMRDPWGNQRQIRVFTRALQIAERRASA